MNMKTDSELLDYFAKTRKLHANTKYGYGLFIRQYSEFHNSTMVELLQEAEDEEEQGIRWKHRKLRKRLIEYRAYLYDNYAYSTAKSRFSKIMAFYKHFAIEIHQLPPIATINVEKTHMGFKDLPDKKIIKKALNVSNPLMKAIILFMVSSGSARAETRSLTIQDFIDATNNEIYSYHNSNDIYDVINLLKDREDIIPLFYLKRQKTNKFYYTFCSPEATISIIEYLSSRNTKLHPNDALFDISSEQFSKAFTALNDRLGLGKLENGRRRLTSHMLRKFHSSQLYGDSVEIVDSLQGRGKDQTHSSYFYENPLKLKEIYIEHLDAVTIDWDVNTLNFKSPEYIQLESENRDLKEENVKYKDIVDNIDERIEAKINAALSHSGDDLDNLFS